MKALEYDRLLGITKNQKAIRGTTNKFPIGKRSHYTKYFLVDELDGEQIFRINYGTRGKEILCSKEECMENLANPNLNYHEKTWETDESKRYCRYIYEPNEFGIVRTDNTFEFTNPRGFGQGDNQIMSGWSYGVFFMSSRHGGMVYSKHNGDRANKQFHPIFRGMRINCDTMQPHESSEYQVMGKRVNRAEGKVFLKGYEDFYKVNEVMLKAMDWKNFMDTGVEVTKPLIKHLEYYAIDPDDKTQLLEFANKNLNEAPLDSCLAFAVAYDINSMWQRVRGWNTPNNWYSSEQDLPTMFNNIKRRLNKELYRANPSVMKKVPYIMGEYFPPSEWGIDITVNGVEVEQY